jgi:hypothetical protein
MKKPYLVQRATINKTFKNKKLSEAVIFDYMGSSEFECGAIPRAFKELKLNKEKLTLSNIILDGKTLWFTHYLTNIDDFSQYVGYLRDLYDDKIRLKETSRFAKNTRYVGNIDFWWDIENNVMWSYNEYFMREILNCLNESFKVIKD